MPAAHSLSPAIHSAGYAAHGLDWRYDAHQVQPEDLGAFLDSCAADPAWVGLSVTAPHKEAVLARGRADEAAQLVGGGNTLLFGEEHRVYNTDVPGFVRAWRARDLKPPRSAAIVGNGVTARAICLALAGIGLREVLVLARVPARAQRLLSLAKSLGMTAEALPLASDPGPVDLLANTIPPPATEEHAPRWARAGVVFDAVYDPWPTPLAQAADETGAVSVNGLDLLAGQAVDQFFLLTGHRVTFEQCYSAATAEMGRRRGL